MMCARGMQGVQASKGPLAITFPTTFCYFDGMLEVGGGVRQTSLSGPTVVQHLIPSVHFIYITFDSFLIVNGF